MLPRGSLRKAIVQRTNTARQSGALQPIGTHVEFIDDGGVRFMVRVASNLDKKAAHTDQVHKNLAARERHASPFLNPDPNLFVTDVTQRYRCLLNKYSVVDEHVLIVTKEFERQESPLNLDDFFALWTCLREYEAVAFYNSGAAAGASQTHKHLQMVPLPLSTHGDSIPIEPLILSALPAEGLARCGSLPFQHGLTRIAQCDGVADLAAESLEKYCGLLAANGLDLQSPSPYNMLLTRRWMLVVPRLRECFDSISLNALAFAGTLFVRDIEQLERLKHAGPMSALKHVGIDA